MTQAALAFQTSSINSEEARLKKLNEIFSLIKNSTSISVVSDFLKDKNLTHSAGSWDEILNKRIIKHYQDGSISIDDLDALLQKTEGYGRQHVFLFKIKSKSVSNLQIYLSKKHIEEGLLKVTDAKLNIAPLYIDLPDKPKIVDARLSNDSPKINDYTLLSLKEIEKRTIQELVYTDFSADKTHFIKKYNIINKRSINAARLWGNGLLEIRISSKDNSVKYETELKSFLHRINSIINIGDFESIALVNLKKNLWEKRVKLTNLVRFSSYSLTDDEGVCLKANVLAESDDLAESDKLGKSLDEFTSSTTLCTDSNIYIKYPLINGESKEIHVLLSGSLNEFAITSSINLDEYDYVLEKILEHN